ncbi:hypothetical protein Q31a_50220 [Aureliella helgolandensis]|uniref:Uncharacterized protein n=1 Tax=Aureliella helgolandensis TaxID=2527968 RepID=A0A518GDG6_9BACT|nr:hypothetical protein Q31a_50220 [Aureliella helgolandensis]
MQTGATQRYQSAADAMCYPPKCITTHQDGANVAPPQIVQQRIPQKYLPPVY